MNKIEREAKARALINAEMTKHAINCDNCNEPDDIPYYLQNAYTIAGIMHVINILKVYKIMDIDYPSCFCQYVAQAHNYRDNSYVTAKEEKDA
jgi:hypothetical protein